MIRNYLLVTLRNIRKNGTYSFINIAGLSIGITCSILILLWVFDEWSYNKFLPKADRLYQLEANVTYDGKINTWGAAPLGAYEGLRPESSKIANTCVVDWGNGHLLTVGEKKIRKRGHFASEEFLTMFEFPLLKGSAVTALSEPGNIVITESMAKSLFGDQDPTNQLVRVDNSYEQKVVGVLKDIPANSTFQFDFLLPWKKMEEVDPSQKERKSRWDNFGYGIYAELNSPSDFTDVENAIRELHIRKSTASDKTRHEFFLYPLTDWRLFNRFENGKVVGGGIEYVRLFTIIAIFILVMACINFMNLATARSERRAREVGIRKSVGSGRWQIVTQFIGESLMIATLSFVVSVILAQLLLPLYNNMVEKQLTIAYSSPLFWAFSLGLIFFTGVISGSYPAFYLSSFRPVQVLKGKVHVGKGGSTPRKVLVTAQFAFSILLIIAMLVVYRQVQFVKNRDMGYDRENLVTVSITADIAKNYQAIKNELLASGLVSSVTKSNSAVTNINNYGFLGWAGQPKDARVLFTNLAAEYDYAKTLGIKVLQGRDFSVDYNDSASLIINKAALDMMGLQDPIGQQVWFPSGKKFTLVGVFENTIMGAPEETVFPMYVEFSPDWVSAATIRLNKTTDLAGAMVKVGSIFQKFSPAFPFEYTFVDVDFGKKFSSINLIGKLANLFTGLAVLITGLGLFGLASFTAEQRTKEIGIRKVLGATVTSLVRLIAQDFSKLVVFAFVLSAPLAWWMLGKFLTRYSYRIDIPWWVFPLTAILALTFALLTVSTQAFRAARINPVKSLRNNE